MTDQLINEQRDGLVNVQFEIRMDKHRSTWHWFCANAQGGGFGSNHCGSKKDALRQALRGVRPGQLYVITTNGKRTGPFVKGAA